VCKLAPVLEKDRNDVPLDFLLGWIAVESNGNLRETTSLDERGYFQIHPDESKDLRLDHQRLSVDSDYSIESGIKLIDFYARQAETLGIPRTSSSFWPIVKFIHAIGMGSAKKFFADMRQHNLSPTDWPAIRNYANSNRERLKKVLKHDPVKWVHNVDAVISKGQSLAESSKKCN